jgi:hypothetical protein
LSDCDGSLTQACLSNRTIDGSQVCGVIRHSSDAR